MKQIIIQATQHQLSSRKGGDAGKKERILSRILTVCFTKGMTLMAKIRDYRGGDYEHEKHVEKYAGACVFSKIEQPKNNKSNQ